jgi:hypothetical protein
VFVIHAVSINQFLSVGTLGFFLVACGSAPITDGFVPPDISVYQAHDIANRQIHFIWIELPSNLNLGTNDIRVFIARTDPPGMLVPTETELPCIIQYENDYLDIRPVTLPFEYDGSQLSGSYDWKACASCVECYMDWETTMEIVGAMEQNKIALTIGIRHMGHNVQDDFLRTELWPEKLSSQEPRILCRRSNDCKNIEFAPRPQD